jgi:hypothetical protein
MKKRVLAIVLAMVLCLALLPVGAMADSSKTISGTGVTITLPAIVAESVEDLGGYTGSVTVYWLNPNSDRVYFAIDTAVATPISLDGFENPFYLLGHELYTRGDDGKFGYYLGGDEGGLAVQADGTYAELSEWKPDFASDGDWIRKFYIPNEPDTYVYVGLYGGEAAPNKPDQWAEAEVNAALVAGLVPDSVANAGWQNATSRLAAAEAMVVLIEEAKGATMWGIAAAYGWDLETNHFSDTNSPAVTFLKYAGVTTGVGDNKYDPDGDYNRAQIVTMIGRAAERFFEATAQGTNPFTDVPDWAAPYVGYAAANGITQGVGGGLFDSYGVLQNQHTAVFGLRAFNVWHT